MTLAGSMRLEFLGMEWNLADAREAKAAVIRLSRAPEFTYVVTPNVDHVVRLHGEAGLFSVYEPAALCLCDSRIIGHLARLSGLDLPVVPGSDLTRMLLEDEVCRYRIAVVGGDPNLHSALVRLYPVHRWSFLAPPMGLRENPEARTAIANFVETSGADVILFAIGAPQSEICCAEILARRKARGVALCIGASLEFLTGAKQRAPKWMQRLSLEWLHRLIDEPQRLWRRYLVEGPRIFAIWRRWLSSPSGINRARSGSSPFGGD